MHCKPTAVPLHIWRGHYINHLLTDKQTVVWTLARACQSVCDSDGSSMRLLTRKTWLRWRSWWWSGTAGHAAAKRVRLCWSQRGQYTDRWRPPSPWLLLPAGGCRKSDDGLCAECRRSCAVQVQYFPTCCAARLPAWIVQVSYCHAVIHSSNHVADQMYGNVYSISLTAVPKGR